MRVAVRAWISRTFLFCFRFTLWQTPRALVSGLCVLGDPAILPGRGGPLWSSSRTQPCSSSRARPPFPAFSSSMTSWSSLQVPSCRPALTSPPGKMSEKDLGGSLCLPHIAAVLLPGLRAVTGTFSGLVATAPSVVRERPERGAERRFEWVAAYLCLWVTGVLCSHTVSHLDISSLLKGFN